MQVSVVAVLAVPEAIFADTEPILGVNVKTAVSSVLNGLLIPILNYLYRMYAPPHLPWWHDNMPQQ